MKKKHVTEEELMKALGELESDAQKSAVGSDDSEDASEEMSKAEAIEEDDADVVAKGKVPEQMKSTKAANGGMSPKGGASEDAEHFETNADEQDPSGGSMKSLVKDSDTIRKGFEVSGFLESLVDAQVTSTDGLSKSVSEFQAEQRAFNAKVQKALIAIGNAVSAQVKKSAELDEQPVVAAPRSVLSKSEVTERFDAPVQQFSRDQVLEALTEMVIEKSLAPLVVSVYETTGHIPPELVSDVNRKLKALAR